SWMGGSALTDAAIDVPKDRDVATMASEIPVTYVPARNALFLCYALAWAEVLGARDLFAGMNALDYSGYPDCRPEFLRAFEEMANRGTRAGAQGEKLAIHAPLIEMTKAQIIREGVRLGVDYAASGRRHRRWPGACRDRRRRARALRRRRDRRPRDRRRPRARARARARADRARSARGLRATAGASGPPPRRPPRPAWGSSA